MKLLAVIVVTTRHIMEFSKEAFSFDTILSEL